jgi:DNA-binding transcriptional ArsR family regulator
MREFLAVVKALADESRTRIVLALRDRELCVCQIVELLRLAPSTVSKHMAILKQAGLVESRKEGRWVHYRLSESAGSLSAQVADLAAEWLRKDARVREDARRLKEILKLDRETLCRQQSECGC